jgi:hypothetical protein
MAIVKAMSAELTFLCHVTLHVTQISARPVRVSQPSLGTISNLERNHFEMIPSMTYNRRMVVPHSSVCKESTRTMYWESVYAITSQVDIADSILMNDTGFVCIVDMDGDSSLRMLDIERIFFCSPMLDYSPADWSPVNVVNGCTSPTMSVEMSWALFDILNPNVNVDCSSFTCSPIKRRYEPKHLDREPDGLQDFYLTPWSVKTNMVKHYNEGAIALAKPDFQREGGWRNGMPLVHSVSQQEYRSLPRVPGETSNLVEMYVDDSKQLSAAECVEDNVSVDTACKQLKDVVGVENSVSVDTASDLAQSELYRSISQLFKDADIDKELVEHDSAELQNRNHLDSPQLRNRNHLLAHKVPSKPNVPRKRRTMPESGPASKKARKSNFVTLTVKIQSIPSVRIARVPFPRASTRVKTNTAKPALYGKVKAAKNPKGFPWLERVGE